MRQIGKQHDYSDSKNPNFKIKITLPPDYNETIQKDLFSNIMNHRKTDKKSLICCCSSSEALLATKSVALKLLNIGYVKLFWIRTPSRVVIFLFLPSIYLFSANNHESLYLYMLLLVAFSAFTVYGLYRIGSPSVRLFVTRKFPILRLFSNGSSSRTPVVWSIGSVNRVVESEVSGFLVKVYSNGDVYEGEFYKGKCSGSGVYYYKLNGRYEGDWVDQKYDGYGVETWAKGSRYRGQYRQGLRHGFGVYRYYVGDMYAGEWIKGQCHGFGVHTCEDGSKYFGEFKGGVKHGLGHYHFRNGDMYSGEYFADKMHGFGVYNFANGHRYEGGWHEGKRQGFGLYTFRNGDTQSGHWEDGVLSINTQYPLSISHAKVHKAVEEARRIAEKAMAAKSVDEKVNRAMAAANRAANAARVAAVKAVQSRVHHYDDPTLVIV
ncbi:putative 1-phosphatidylinositol-4-phosphate 5-kinase [Helianthus annuus]|nr:putative 1-phosphatidylinositol-4-phosphate 5-kinase [Helianthus annuus]KAJ0628878.1 putative 1-phosphatidylinositol-4-phosphate 5-kinase [Helianthus annuus]